MFLAVKFGGGMMFGVSGSSVDKSCFKFCCVVFRGMVLYYFAFCCICVCSDVLCLVVLNCVRLCCATFLDSRVFDHFIVKARPNSCLI